MAANTNLSREQLQYQVTTPLYLGGADPRAAGDARVYVRPVVAQSWASIVPLRLGAGTRVKVLESMALGTPVVSTTKGAEGLEVRDGENILIADSPTEFAKRVVDLLRSPELRARLATAGRRLVESKHDWEVVGQELRALVERVGTCQLIRRGAS